MADKIINNYIIYKNSEGYVTGFGATLEENYDYRGQMGDYPEATEGWYKFINGSFIVDEDKKAEIIAEREAEKMKPTDFDRVEAQTFYTALVTDTLLEEE